MAHKAYISAVGIRSTPGQTAYFEAAVKGRSARNLDIQNSCSHRMTTAIYESGAKCCFNTSPDTTVAAFERALGKQI